MYMHQVIKVCFRIFRINIFLLRDIRIIMVPAIQKDRDMLYQNLFRDTATCNFGMMAYCQKLRMDTGHYNTPVYERLVIYSK